MGGEERKGRVEVMPHHVYKVSALLKEWLVYNHQNMGQPSKLVLHEWGHQNNACVNTLVMYLITINHNCYHNCNQQTMSILFQFRNSHRCNLLQYYYYLSRMWVVADKSVGLLWRQRTVCAAYWPGRRVCVSESLTRCWETYIMLLYLLSFLYPV